MTTAPGGAADRFVEAGKAGRPVTHCTVIDAHTHIGPMPGMAVPASTAASLIETMDRLGIDRAYASGLPAIYSTTDGWGNDLVLDAVRQYPDRIGGYMVACCGYRERILPELRRCYDAGLRAVKIWSYGNRQGIRYDHANYRIVFEFANDHGLPILAHTWAAELDQLREAFETYPNVRWLLAHSGAAELAKYVDAANRHEQVFLETCFSGCPRGLFETLVEQVPLRKIIWGSDQVFMGAAHQLGRVLFAQITPEQKQAILGRNAEVFFAGG